MNRRLVLHAHPSPGLMALVFHVALFFQIVGWVYAERLPSPSDASVAPTPATLDGPNTSLKPMIPIIVGSVIAGFVGFLLIVFAGMYLVRRRRTKDVDNMVEGAHFPTVGYNQSYPISPPMSARSRMSPPYTGYSYWEKPDERAPAVPPGLPILPVRS
ncbi:unnamed protein product [Rhizoctonia solani]|uniref:Uncharacterized protein n=1 Tax=Rhizoctonia solani TaxID=456999 RepID=A0A8H3DYL6_9AGAM|nr:unnamed protein product [Rhizoctonia solani]